MKLHLLYFSEKSTFTVRNEIVEIKAFQIIVWVSISNRPVSPWDSKLPRIPAILDIGTTPNFALTSGHLRKWAGLQPDSLPVLGKIRKDHERAFLRKAGIWLHSDDEPSPLDVRTGIAVFDGDWPRLPILGLRALTNSNLQTFIYGDTKQVLIRMPPRWYWPF